MVRHAHCTDSWRGGDIADSTSWPELKFAILAIMTCADGGQPFIDRCDPATDKEALALAAQAWPEAERAGYWQAIRSLVSEGDPDRAVLLAVHNANRLLAAHVAQLLPGNVAVVWP